MRITLVVAHLSGGGGERAMATLANGWARRGEEVTVLSFAGEEAPAYEIDPRVKVQRLGLLGESGNFLHGLMRNVRRVRALRRAIHEAKPDVIISWMETTNVVTLLATRGLRLPTVICEQTDPALYRLPRRWAALRRLTYRWADSLVCPVRASLARFEAAMRVRGCVIPNPVEVPRATGQTPRRSDVSTLVGMGRLVPQKGFDLLLQAFAGIAERHPTWRLVIYGQGPELERLRAQATSLGLSSRVEFAGAVSDPFSRLYAADLFVFPSRFEGFGMALAEAMACGLPVVSFACPEGPADIIRDGVDGMLVPPEDVGALARALDRLMGDAQERARLARRAPEGLARFGIEAVLAGWQELFARLAVRGTDARRETSSAAS